MAAQACDTPELAALLPGMVAQPPFPTYAACSHVLVFFSAVKVVGGVGAALELVDADRRYRRNHGATGRAVRQGLGRASKHEPAPAESDAERRERTEGGAL